MHEECCDNLGCEGRLYRWLLDQSFSSGAAAAIVTELVVILIASKGFERN